MPEGRAPQVGPASDTITHGLSEINSGGGPAKVAGPILALRNGIQYSIMNPVRFVVKVQMPQHHD